MDAIINYEQIVAKVVRENKMTTEMAALHAATVEK